MFNTNLLGLSAKGRMGWQVFTALQKEKTWTLEEEVRKVTEIQPYTAV